MNPKKIWSNLAVDNLDITTKFYTDLGFKSNGRSAELTSFLIGENDFVMHFFLKNVLKESIKGELADPGKANEVVFTLSAQSREQVDTWSKEVAKAGGVIITGPEEFGNEYYGFLFADPDGHKLNVFYMQGL